MTSIRYVQGPLRVNRSGRLDGDTVSCPEGEYPIGGGVNADFFTQNVVESHPTRSQPTGRIDSWYVALVNGHGTTDPPFYAYAICIPASSVSANF